MPNTCQKKTANPPILITPFEILTDKRLTLRQIRVLMAICSWRKSNTNLARISRQMISDRTGYTLSRISNITTELVALKWLKKSGNLGKKQWAEYQLQELKSGTTPVPKSGTTPVPKSGTTPVPKSGTTPVPKSGTTPVPKSGTSIDTKVIDTKVIDTKVIDTIKKYTKKKISYSEKVKNFEPNEATANTFKKKYPYFANEKEEYLKLLEQFKDQALNRKNPFLDLNAGMRTYIEHEYIKPSRQVVRKNEIGSFKDIGDIVRAKKNNNTMAVLPKQILINQINT